MNFRLICGWCVSNGRPVTVMQEGDPGAPVSTGLCDFCGKKLWSQVDQLMKEKPSMPTNDQRADHVGAILESLRHLQGGNRGEPDEAVLKNLMTDLAHYCDREDLKLEDLLKYAVINYVAEVSDGKQFYFMSDEPSMDFPCNLIAPATRVVNAWDGAISIEEVQRAHIASEATVIGDLAYFWSSELAGAVRDLASKLPSDVLEEGGMRIWTITVQFPDPEDKPMVDLMLCDHEPTWDEIVKVHPHLVEYSPDEDRIFIERYEGIPTI